MMTKTLLTATLLLEANGEVSVVAVMRDGEGREVLPVVQPFE